ncbi:ABC transporter ATP-binding protein [Aliishimia ponticola]|uniref:ABC transporter ATP-binding protein n=1 Tax=Aliishimia ponticola TaxID=2499833 RepID=A0A4S4N557_9RHOB|nr:ABC transporter ATP-binding protein [Aliishimia ponticola]THH34202.1 ABC transporter ATP-binding protein [Aliishimia ponticola]
MTEPILSIRNAVKRYGSLHALDHVDLDVSEGEFLTLLGPSGSGKTTLLSAIAGFVGLATEQITLRSADITRAPLEYREFGMVFQGYALFPPMTVSDNVAFPFMVRKRPAAEIAERTQECLELVQMGGFTDGMPHQLSGGQQQRVALARAISFKPQVLLLDEPLSALDKKLHADLQWEFKSLHSQLGVTFIYVTHDQDEALSMSDRIVILKDGCIQQQRSSGDLHNSPRNSFVADFLGKSNYIDVDVTGRNVDILYCAAKDATFEVQAENVDEIGSKARLALRSERLRIDAPGVELLSATVKGVSYLGERCQVIVEDDGLGDLLISCTTLQTGITPTPGLEISIGWDTNACVVLVPE